jgi:hypothetical protein
MNNNSDRSPLGVAIKFWLFRHYWWMLGLLLAAILGYGLLKQLGFSDLAPFLAVVLSGLYFLQKQKLEELKMFRELFESCNKRYDEMNSELDSINATPTGSLSETEKHILADYFNLCAEEYLYFSKGYIYPEVWTAWYNGMLFYLANSRIRDFWEEECASNSHYGLQFETDAS